MEWKRLATGLILENWKGLSVVLEGIWSLGSFQMKRTFTQL